MYFVGNSYVTKIFIFILFSSRGVQALLWLCYRRSFLSLFFFFTWGVKCGFGCTYSGPQVISPLLSNCTLSLMISVDSRVQATIMLTAS